LAEAIRKETNKTIWCFSGFTYEHLIKDKRQRKLLELVDVLVDGPFVKALRDEDLVFRGSSNQRIINVKKSLQEGKIVLQELDI
jgi:anaerobic ribonucleoside-triphosphate reductase activating protein